jgi:hypothetical protein
MMCAVVRLEILGDIETPTTSAKSFKKWAIIELHEKVPLLGGSKFIRIDKTLPLQIYGCGGFAFHTFTLSPKS